MQSALYVLTPLLYLAAMWLVARPNSGASLPSGATAHSGASSPGQSGPLALAVLAGAIAAHLVGLFLPLQHAIHAGEALRFGFAPALSAALCIGALILWFESWRLRMAALWVLVLPAAALFSLLPAVFPGAPLRASTKLPLFVPHLMCGMVAYGLFAFAALLALMMMLAEKRLHAGGGAGAVLASPVTGSACVLPGGWRSGLDLLPPLLVMERLLFRMIGIGFLFLTLTVVTGIFFSEETFGRAWRFDHKTVFTVLGWLMMGALLVGRMTRGWRGRTALRLTLGGFGFLLLAYVGSRFVLEVVLKRGV